MGYLITVKCIEVGSKGDGESRDPILASEILRILKKAFAPAISEDPLRVTVTIEQTSD